MRTTIRNIFAAYTGPGRFWLSLGIVALIVDASISYQYGISLTTLHGLGFALVAIFFALLPDAAYSEIESKRIASGVVMAALCVPLGIVAFYSHLGYGAGVRVGDMQQTGVQNVRYDDAREKVADNKRNVSIWTDQLAELTKQAPWAATVNPDGLKAQLASADKSIELEGKRGGCKSRCLALMKAKAGLQERIATAERATDLQTRIAATQRLIDGYREAAAKTDFRSSPVVNQNNVAAQLFLAVTGAGADKAIKPDEVTSSFTSIFIAGGGSLAFMLMAPVGFFLAGRNRIVGITNNVTADVVHAAPVDPHSRSNMTVTVTPLSRLVRMPDGGRAAA